ncbi:hypothetical protein QLX52_30580 [Streptomyces albus]|uniref:hypothetical protein n=1 Tax=Streptomyces albus TaxID=1888 RepID=UPI0024ACD406|nr:hypothetical protein [Streptomyces albus]MDI6413156.1 hypothetical protein [Streptomyces albus]
MSRYLEEAAAVLRRAASRNERYSDHDRDIEITRGFSVLAAIDKGLLPAEVTETVLDTLRNGGAR